MTACWESIQIVKESANFVKMLQDRWRRGGSRREVSWKLQTMSSVEQCRKYKCKFVVLLTCYECYGSKASDEEDY